MSKIKQFIKVFIYYFIDNDKKVVFDFEEIASHFEEELNKLNKDKDINIKVSLSFEKKY